MLLGVDSVRGSLDMAAVSVRIGSEANIAGCGCRAQRYFEGVFVARARQVGLAWWVILGSCGITRYPGVRQREQPLFSVGRIHVTRGNR